MGPLVLHACITRCGDPAPAIGASTRPPIHGRAIRSIRGWLCPSFLSPPIPRLHLPSERLSGFGVAEGGGGTPRTPPSPRTYFVEGSRRKAEGTCYPRVEGGA